MSILEAPETGCLTEELLSSLLSGFFSTCVVLTSCCSLTETAFGICEGFFPCSANELFLSLKTLLGFEPFGDIAFNCSSSVSLCF